MVAWEDGGNPPTVAGPIRAKTSVAAGAVAREIVLVEEFKITPRQENARRGSSSRIAEWGTGGSSSMTWSAATSAVAPAATFGEATRSIAYKTFSLRGRGRGNSSCRTRGRDMDGNNSIIPIVETSVVDRAAIFGEGVLLIAIKIFRPRWRERGGRCKIIVLWEGVKCMHRMTGGAEEMLGNFTDGMMGISMEGRMITMNLKLLEAVAARIETSNIEQLKKVTGNFGISGIISCAMPSSVKNNSNI